MAEHLYLKLDGIDGSCVRKGHDKWIELLSYSHGINYSVGSGKDFAGAVDHQLFSIMKMTDASSYGIIEKLNRRGVIKTINLEIWKDKGEKDGTVDSAAIKIKLTNGMNNEITMKPTAPPRKTIINGSNKAIKPSVSVLTSSSY